MDQSSQELSSSASQPAVIQTLPAEIKNNEPSQPDNEQLFTLPDPKEHNFIFSSPITNKDNYVKYLFVEPLTEEVKTADGKTIDVSRNTGWLPKESAPNDPYYFSGGVKTALAFLTQNNQNRSAGEPPVSLSQFIQTQEGSAVFSQDQQLTPDETKQYDLAIETALVEQRLYELEEKLKKIPEEHRTNDENEDYEDLYQLHEEKLEELEKLYEQAAAVQILPERTTELTEDQAREILAMLDESTTEENIQKILKAFGYEDEAIERFILHANISPLSATELFFFQKAKDQDLIQKAESSEIFKQLYDRIRMEFENIVRSKFSTKEGSKSLDQQMEDLINTLPISKRKADWLNKKKNEILSTAGIVLGTVGETTSADLDRFINFLLLGQSGSGLESYTEARSKGKKAVGDKEIDSIFQSEDEYAESLENMLEKVGSSAVKSKILSKNTQEEFKNEETQKFDKNLYRAWLLEQIRTTAEQQPQQFITAFQEELYEKYYSNKSHTIPVIKDGEEKQESVNNPEELTITHEAIEKFFELGKSFIKPVETSEDSS